MSETSGTSGTSGTTIPAQSQPVGDPANTDKFKIVESTLRVGEQFPTASFDTETKINIAKALDEFGVDYIELSSPCVSQQAFEDCYKIAHLGLKAKVLTQVRCTLEDAKKAVETGVGGVSLVIGSSSELQESPYSKDLESIKKSAIEVINYVKSQGLEVRFSSEGSFRSDLIDILSIYKAVDEAGVDRVGIADNTGLATPRQVHELVRTLRGVVSCGIQTQFYDDTGCAIANSYASLEAGATHIVTSVLGIGERKGITPLGVLMARTIVSDREYVTGKFKLHKLKEIEEIVAKAAKINVPFNNPVTGSTSFTHKAGIHSKAILNNASTYEIINPADFGVNRTVHFGSALTGWNAIKSRVEQLGLKMTDEQVKELTAKIKAEGDTRTLAIGDTDEIIRSFHTELESRNKTDAPEQSGATEKAAVQQPAAQ